MINPLTPTLVNDPTYLEMFRGWEADNRTDDGAAVLADWLEENGHAQEATDVRACLKTYWIRKSNQQGGTTYVQVGSAWLIQIPPGDAYTEAEVRASHEEPGRFGGMNVARMPRGGWLVFQETNPNFIIDQHVQPEDMVVLERGQEPEAGEHDAVVPLPDAAALAALLEGPPMPYFWVGENAPLRDFTNGGWAALPLPTRS